MPILKQLREAGFSIWPFDLPRLPMVVEIYPRVLTGPVNNSDEAERRRYLARYFPALAGELLERGRWERGRIRCGGLRARHGRGARRAARPERVGWDSPYPHEGNTWLPSASRAIGELRTRLAPALSEAEWKERRSGAVKIDYMDGEPYVVVTDPEGDFATVSGSDQIFKLIALANHALPKGCSADRSRCARRPSFEERSGDRPSGGDPRGDAHAPGPPPRDGTR